MEKKYTLNLTAEELDVLESSLLQASLWFANESTTYTRAEAEHQDYFEQRFFIADNLLGRVVELMGITKK